MGESRIMFKVGDLVRISPEWLRECEDKIPMGVIARTYPETPPLTGVIVWMCTGLTKEKCTTEKIREL